jgi:hypothetical protein
LNFIVVVETPNLGKAEKQQKSGAGAAQRVFFFPRLRHAISNGARHVRLSCPRRHPSIDHHITTTTIIIIGCYMGVVPREE